MTRTTSSPTPRCETLCQCGTCGFPVRLVPTDSSAGRAFDVKAGEVTLVGLYVYPARAMSKRESAVLVGDMSGRVPFSKAQRLSPEDAIRFVKSLGFPGMLFVPVLVELGWIEPPACVDCGEPAYKRLPCGHPLCDDCRQAADDYTDVECSTCDGASVPCRLATTPPNVPPDDWLEAVYLWCEHCGWRGPSSEAAGYVGQLDEWVCPQCNHYGTVNEVGVPPEPPPDDWLEAAYESRTELDDRA
jgi:hypothetical protein